MKLTSLSVIFIIIITPFLFISAKQSDLANEDARLRIYYDSVIDNAIQDAAMLLAKGAGFSYNSEFDISDSKAVAAKTFYDSMYHAFNVNCNVSSMARVDACVPVLVFLQNEGYCLYALNSFQGSEGYTLIKHCWFPLRHYIGDTVQNRYSIRYTLGKKVYIFDRIDSMLYEGDYHEFRDSIEFFNDSEQFENLKLAAIKNSVENALEDYLNEYDRWAFGRSLSVKLEFPRIDDTDWKRAIKDEGIITFAQGFPVFMGKSYKHYALGGARIIRKAQLTGYLYKDLLFYCRQDCEFYLSSVINDSSYNPDNITYFSDAREAAKNGYYPCPHCRP